MLLYFIIVPLQVNWFRLTMLKLNLTQKALGNWCIKAPVGGYAPLNHTIYIATDPTPMEVDHVVHVCGAGTDISLCAHIDFIVRPQCLLSESWGSTYFNHFLNLHSARSYSMIATARRIRAKVYSKWSRSRCSPKYWTERGPSRFAKIKHLVRCYNMCTLHMLHNGSPKYIPRHVTDLCIFVWLWAYFVDVMVEIL